MFKTIDSLLEFTNETKFKRLGPKMQQIRKLDERERASERVTERNECVREGEKGRGESAFVLVNCVKNNGMKKNRCDKQ